MKFLKKAYWSSIAPFTVFFAASVLFIAFYRLQIHFLIQSIYPDFSALSFLRYLSWCFTQDAFILFLLALVFFIILMIFAFLPQLKLILSSLVLFIYSVLLILAIDFFRFYETSFQKTYIAGEALTNTLSNMVQSVLAEISFSGYVLLSVSLILNVVICLLVFKLSRKYSFSSSRPPSKKYSFLPLLILIPFFAGFVSLLWSGKKVFAEKQEAQAYEFSINPLTELFPWETRKGQFFDESKEGAGAQKIFHHPFDTRSLESKTQIPALNLIPKGKKYNIILYAFESTPYQYFKIKINDQWVMRTWNRLEKNSVLFENHYSLYPLSANALFSVMASAYDPNSRESAIEKYPTITIKTLPEVLKENGYRTAYIHTGFLEYARQINFLKHRKFDLILEFKDLIGTSGFEKNVGWGADERTMIEPAVDFIKKNSREPFFLAMFPVNPHHPYAIPSKEYQITGEIPDYWDDRKQTWNNYLNSLYFADSALGDLLDRLEKEGLMENTILVLYADHGEAFYQHRMNYNHPFFLYEENVHVPFLIYSKNLIKEMRRYPSVSRHIDIAPTILDLLGIKPPIEYEGLPLFRPHPEQMAILHASWKDDYRGVRDGKWKYIRKTVTGSEELYDLEKDPGEKVNVAAHFPEIALKYRKKTQEGSSYKEQFFQVFYDAKKLIQARKK